MSDTPAKTKKERLEARRVERRRTAIFTAIVMVLLIAAPISYGWGRRAAERARTEVQTTTFLRDAMEGKKPASPPPDIIPNPPWARHVGTIRTGKGKLEESFTSYSASGGRDAVRDRYRALMVGQGWKLSSEDREASALFFYRVKGVHAWFAEVLIAEMSKGEVSISVAVRVK